MSRKIRNLVPKVNIYINNLTGKRISVSPENKVGFITIPGTESLYSVSELVSFLDRCIGSYSEETLNGKNESDLNDSEMDLLLDSITDSNSKKSTQGKNVKISTNWDKVRSYLRKHPNSTKKQIKEKTGVSESGIDLAVRRPEVMITGRVKSENKYRLR